MSLEQAVQDLTQTTENLLVEVNTRKLDLVDAVNQAEQAAATADGHASTAVTSATTATSKASEAATAAAAAVAAQQAAESAVDALVASPSVDTIVVLTQAAYDAITPVAGSLYVVQG